ncbi:MAG: helix-turn-helix domain-containing protein [Bryobacteraceae bacterium]
MLRFPAPPPAAFPECPPVQPPYARLLKSQPSFTFNPESALHDHLPMAGDALKLLWALLQRQYTVCDASVSVAPEPLIAEKMTRAIHEQYASPTLALKTIAKAEHRSARYLGRVFKKSTGLLFRTHLRAVRIDEGARLLLTSEHEVKTVAGLVGYNDPSRFSEDFRLLKGCPPTACRARAKSALA